MYFTNFNPIFKLGLTLLASFIFLNLATSCRKSQPSNTDQNGDKTTINNIHVNNLGRSAKNIDQSTFLLSQKNSPIHWQTWDLSIFDDAKKVNKTVFAIIGSGTDPYTLKLLNNLNHAPHTCNLLNKNHINILIDSSLHPDIDFFTASLVGSSRTIPTRPFLLWFSNEGIPISWISIDHANLTNSPNFISRTSTTVSTLWRDSNDYVISNSRQDIAKKTKHSLPSPCNEDKGIVTTRAIRQLASLFDPTTNTIDGINNLSYARYIKLLCSTTYHPDISKFQKQHYTEIAAKTANALLFHGLIDPLDGGVYAGIQQSSVALPIFSKPLTTQAYTIDALYSLYKLTKNPQALQAAEAVVQYTEKNLKLPDGTYSFGILETNAKSQNNPCLWTLEELEAALSPEELKLSLLAFGIKGLGNIPLEDDKNRIYFRKNSLLWKRTPEELAHKLNKPLDQITKQLESITKKLAKLRTEKAISPIKEKVSTPQSMGLLASAYVTAYQVTKNKSHLQRATAIIEEIEKNWIDQSGLLSHASFNGKRLKLPALASDYAHICKASLDLYQATQSKKYLKLATSLHSTMMNRFKNGDKYFLLENLNSAYPYPLSPYQRATFSTIDNTNTWAIAYSNAYRINQIKPSTTLKSQIDDLLPTLLSRSNNNPFTNIDTLTEISQNYQYQ